MSWVEKYDGLNLAGVSNFTWTDRDLFTLYSVPKGSVVLMALMNNEVDSDNTMGVRQNGSALGRTIQIQEAEGGGVQVTMFFCQTDSDGVIEIYTGDANNTDFALIGYLTGCSYTELVPTTEDPAAPHGNWRSVGDVAYASRVVNVLMYNIEVASEWLCGVRAIGSGLNRTFDIMEREGAGISTLGGTLVQADGSGDFEGFREDGSVHIQAVGYFSSNVSFTEAHTDEEAGSDAAWGNETVTAPANSLAHYIITNQLDTDERWGGIRENGSAINRRFNIREAEGGGVSGFGDLVNVDGAQVIENYVEEGADIDLWYEGYLTIIPTWAHKIYGVANANIGKIMGVSKANIEKVMGVT